MKGNNKLKRINNQIVKFRLRNELNKYFFLNIKMYSINFNIMTIEFLYFII